MLTKKMMKSMNEDGLRELVLVPLLQEMGYQDVFLWHGPNELGKDIVAFQVSKLGTRENTVVVAKARRVSAGTDSIADVVMQVNQAFNSGFDDPVSREHQSAHWCWVVTNKAMSRDARKSIEGAISERAQNRVRLFDGNQLWDLVERYLSVRLRNSIGIVRDELAEAISSTGVGIHLPAQGKPLMSIESGGVRVEVTDELLKEQGIESLKFNTVFKFPDTPEGLLHAEALREHFATGSRVEIPGEYVSIDAPDVIKKISSQVFGLESFELERLKVWSTPNPEPLLVDIQIASDDGKGETLRHVELKRVQAGEEEVTFSNADQTHSILVVLRVDLRTRRNNLVVQPKSWPISAVTFDSLIRLGKCMNLPGTWKIIRIDTGQRISSGRNNPTGDHLQFLDFAEFAEDMALLQRKLEIPILIPQGEFSEEDQDAIAFLRSMLHSDMDRQTWDRIVFTVSRGGATDVLHSYKESPTNAWAIVSDVTVKLFGNEIPVGQVRQVYPSVVLENEAEIRSKLTSEDEDEIEIKFVPRESTLMRFEFLE